MKSILLSIKPEWVAKILNGEKTIEIRKSMPKCDLPIDVYIYCTKEDNLCCIKRIDRDRYICGKDFDLRVFPHLSSGYDGKGKVVAKFTLNDAWFLGSFMYDCECEHSFFLKPSCLTPKEVCEYSEYGKKCLYAWHIEDLVIFDRPRDISEFKGVCPIKKGGCRLCKYGGIGLSLMPLCRKPQLTKAPQNYCYIEGE